jgi:hypothetical protein
MFHEKSILLQKGQAFWEQEAIGLVGQHMLIGCFCRTMTQLVTPSGLQIRFCYSKLALSIA